MSGKDLDPVEWELVRADIAMEKARLKANGDWSKWEAFQAQADARFAGFAASSWTARRARPETGAEGVAQWRELRTTDLSALMASFRWLRRRNRPRR